MSTKHVGNHDFSITIGKAIERIDAGEHDVFTGGENHTGFFHRESTVKGSGLDASAKFSIAIPETWDNVSAANFKTFAGLAKGAIASTLDQYSTPGKPPITLETPGMEPLKALVIDIETTLTALPVPAASGQATIPAAAATGAPVVAGQASATGATPVVEASIDCEFETEPLARSQCELAEEKASHLIHIPGTNWDIPFQALEIGVPVVLVAGLFMARKGVGANFGDLPLLGKQIFARVGWSEVPLTKILVLGRAFKPDGWVQGFIGWAGAKLFNVTTNEKAAGALASQADELGEVIATQGAALQTVRDGSENVLSAARTGDTTGINTALGGLDDSLSSTAMRNALQDSERSAAASVVKAAKADQLAKEQALQAAEAAQKASTTVETRQAVRTATNELAEASGRVVEAETRLARINRHFINTSDIRPVNVPVPNQPGVIAYLPAGTETSATHQTPRGWAWVSIPDAAGTPRDFLIKTLTTPSIADSTAQVAALTLERDAAVAANGTNTAEVARLNGLLATAEADLIAARAAAGGSSTGAIDAALKSRVSAAKAAETAARGNAETAAVALRKAEAKLTEKTTARATAGGTPGQSVYDEALRAETSAQKAVDRARAALTAAETARDAAAAESAAATEALVEAALR